MKDDRYYLKFEGIQGGVTSPRYRGWLDAESFSISMTNGIGGAASSFQPRGHLSFVVRRGPANQALASACVDETRFREVILVSMTEWGGEHYQVKFEDASIADVSISSRELACTLQYRKVIESTGRVPSQSVIDERSRALIQWSVNKAKELVRAK